MSDLTPQDRDELASAYLDGEATAEEQAIVEADPALLARVEQFRQAATEVANPVVEVGREKIIAQALEISATRRRLKGLVPKGLFRKLRIPPQGHRRLVPIYSVAAVLVVAFLATSIFLLLSNDDSLEDSDAAFPTAELPPATTQALASLSESASFPTTVLATSERTIEIPATITQAPAADDTSFDAADLSSSDSSAASGPASEAAPALAPPDPEARIDDSDLEFAGSDDITAADMDDGFLECLTAEEANLSGEQSAELAEPENNAESENREASPESPSTTVPVPTTTVPADSEFQSPSSTSTSTSLPEPTEPHEFQLECP